MTKHDILARGIAGNVVNTTNQTLTNYYTKLESDVITNEISNDLSNLETNVSSNYALKSELSSIASGSPKGVYSTLVDLETAYPSGNTNIYVVMADGKWYFWNTNAWTAGGVYQATSIADESITTPMLADEYGIFGFYKDSGKNLLDTTFCENLPFTSFATVAGAYTDILIDNDLLENNVPYVASLVFTDGYKTNGANELWRFRNSSGTVITSAGLGTSVTNANTKSATMVSFYFNATGIANYSSKTIAYIQLEQATTPSYVYEQYNLVYKSSIIDNKRDESIKITTNDIDFVTQSKNLFDKTTITRGYFINYTNGVLSVNPNYCATDYIPVDSNTIYTSSFGHQVAFFNANKIYVGGVNGSGVSPYTFTTGSTTKYIRTNYINDDTKLAISQLERGSSSTSYEEYGLFLNNEIKVSKNLQTPKIFLPSEICIAVGRTIEIYNSQIFINGNSNNYLVKYTCSIGNTYKRKWSCVGTSSNIGNYTLIATIYDENLNEVTSATTVIKIINKNTDIINPKKILSIGDSLTNGKAWLNEWYSLSESMFGKQVVEFVGTRGTSPYKHEGRSGVSAYFYATNSTDILNGNYRFTVQNVTDIPIVGKQYSVQVGVLEYNIFEVSVLNLDGSGNGTIDMIRINGCSVPYSIGTMNELDSSIIGAEVISYNSILAISKNPFWNPNINQVDFNYYSTQNLIYPDAIQIYLGTNELLYDPTTTVNSIKILIDAIQRDWNKPIYLVLPQFWGSQDGLAISFGNQFLDIEQKTKVYNLITKLYDLFKTYSSVYFVPICTTHDSEYNFGSNPTNVNPRSSTKINYPFEAVHPQNEGYMQMADIMFSTWLAHYFE